MSGLSELIPRAGPSDVKSVIASAYPETGVEKSFIVAFTATAL